MALVACRECGAEVSSEAAACPRCGAAHPATGAPVAAAHAPVAATHAPVRRTGSRIGWMLFLVLLLAVAAVAAAWYFGYIRFV